MFEYLMPLLFQRSMSNTLLEEAARDAIAVQRRYARRQRVPWGISESGFADLDVNRIYQYWAFGVPQLRLKRETEEKVVVAPYASLLAVSYAPRETMRNLRRLAALGLLDRSRVLRGDRFQPPARGRSGERGVIVQAYMAHHQGMSFLSLTNFLLGGAMRRRFHADARVRAIEPLLHERVPVLPSLHHIATRDQAQAADRAGGVAPSTSTFDTSQTRTPRTQLLSNGRYAVMLTNTGSAVQPVGRGGDHAMEIRPDPRRVGNLPLRARGRIG